MITLSFSGPLNHDIITVVYHDHVIIYDDNTITLLWKHFMFP
jgi:hypothetical protein